MPRTIEREQNFARKLRLATHFNALATHVLERTVEPEIRQQAEVLRNRAGRMSR